MRNTMQSDAPLSCFLDHTGLAITYPTITFGFGILTLLGLVDGTDKESIIT